MKERIFTTKEQGRVLVEAGLPISTASGFRDKYLDQLHSMEDNAGRIGLIEAVTPDISNPVWDVEMNQLTEAGAMISLAIELLTSNIRHSYGEINFERYPRPVEVEGEDKH